ncbi:hypothetical protein [Alteromonas confluentis]|uniref:Uncharacterized protein n=1 Tax=Alteromonas confluentis TaxID=1656094 RepID=A0A1E7Z7P7_9ALTE|nr:hypothetical protein [Alteromonas confluentis]OFC69546.1 hypothetical protein BFC18_17640 [Alteromonas confluentis]
MTDKYAAWKTPAPEKTHWFAWLQKRNVHLLAVSLLVIASIFLALTQRHYAQQSLEKAAALPVDVLAEQYSMLLADAVAQKHADAIDAHLTRLVSSPVIRKAAVFDVSGRELSSAISETAPATLDSNTPFPVKMQPIMNPDHIQTGVLQIVFDDDALLEERRQLISADFMLQAALLIIGIISGVIITLLGWRYRYLLQNSNR